MIEHFAHQRSRHFKGFELQSSNKTSSNEISSNDKTWIKKVLSTTYLSVIVQPLQEVLTISDTFDFWIPIFAG